MHIRVYEKFISKEISAQEQCIFPACHPCLELPVKSLEILDKDQTLVPLFRGTRKEECIL